MCNSSEGLNVEILWAVVRCYGNVVSSAQCKQIDHQIK